MQPGKNKFIIYVIIFLQFVVLCGLLIFSLEDLPKIVLEVIFVASTIAGLFLSLFQRKQPTEFYQADTMLKSTNIYYAPIALILFLSFVYIFCFIILPKAQ